MHSNWRLSFIAFSSLMSTVHMGHWSRKPIWMQLTLAQRQLRTFVRSRAIHELEEHELQAFTNYQDNLHREAQEIAQWAEGVGNPEKLSGIYERLLAMYCIAGKGVEAEQALWQMKFSGRAPPIEMYNTIIGICGFGNQRVAASRILHRSLFFLQLSPFCNWMSLSKSAVVLSICSGSLHVLFWLLIWLIPVAHLPTQFLLEKISTMWDQPFRFPCKNLKTWWLANPNVSAPIQETLASLGT